MNDDASATGVVNVSDLEVERRGRRLQSSVDWTDFISEAMDQGQCDSCYALVARHIRYTFVDHDHPL